MVTRDGLVKEFADVAFKQKIGTVSPLVKTQFGYHIILVKDRAAKGAEPFAKIKTDLKAYLTQQKKVETVQKLINGLKSNASIEYVDEFGEHYTLQVQILKYIYICLITCWPT